MRFNFILLPILVTLLGCAHYADLRNETAGSIMGSLAGGFLAGSEIASDLITIGAGTITGSILGGIIGASFDDMNRVHLCDPSAWPITIDSYDTYRPFYLADFSPGLIIPPESSCKYCPHVWHDLPLL